MDADVAADVDAPRFPEEYGVLTWVPYCGSTHDEVIVHGAWIHEDGRFQVAWSTPGEGDDVPSRPLVVLSVEGPVPSTVVSERFRH